MVESYKTLVTSLAEVWIEITFGKAQSATQSSLPLRKCGLKSYMHWWEFQTLFVTSLAEVWIEIVMILSVIHQGIVTSLAEVWIEMLGIQ